MSVPSMTIEPLSGLIRPMRVLRKTDLPVPEGPSITQISPAGIVRVTSPQISCLPNDLVRSFTAISTPMCTLLPCGRAARLPPRCSRVDNAPGRERLRPERDGRHACGRDEGRPPWGDRPSTDAATAARAAGAGPGASGGSLDRDGGAGGLEGLLGLVRGSLVDTLEDRLGRGLDQVLGLLQAEGGQGAHLLDDVDLLVAGGLEDDLEVGLLLRGGVATSGTTGGRGGGHGDGGSGGHAEGVLELLHELGELDEGHLLERVKELVGAELRHDGKPFVCGAVAVCDCAGF